MEFTGNANSLFAEGEIWIMVVRASYHQCAILKLSLNGIAAQSQAHIA